MAKNQPPATPPKRPWLKILAGVLAGGLLGTLLLLAFALWQMERLAKTLPTPQQIKTEQMGENTQLFDRHGNRLGALFIENREYVPLEKINPQLIQAFLAVEDSEFMHHRGVRFSSLIRAVLATTVLRGRWGTQGGSTITMQLVRTLYLGREKTISRKSREILISLMLEQRYSKEELLEMYLNSIYFGENAYGVRAASDVYFSKSLNKLSLAESALVAGLVQSPSRLSPYRNKEGALQRRATVLGRMRAVGYVTEENYQKALKEPLRLKYQGIPPAPGLKALKFPYFTSYVMHQLVEAYGHGAVFTGGLKVYTTLDPALQSAAEQALKNGLWKYGKGHDVGQGALVSVEVDTGHVLAMVGGRDFAQSEFNRAWQARRQPGSSFKPFVYATACEQGHPMGSVVVDAPIRIHLGGGRYYSPKNSGGGYHGAITYRQALAQSVNVAAVKVMAKVGPRDVISTARKMGISTPLKANLSLALGAGEVIPLEMASAFAVFAQRGEYVSPVAITKVVDPQGRLLELPAPQRYESAMSEKCAASLTDAMKDVVTRGTARRAAVRGAVIAGKTGTTSDYKDAWFVGFSPRVATAVWVGNDTGKLMKRVFGGTVPAPVFSDYMRVATRQYPAERFPEPSDLTNTDRGLEQSGEPEEGLSDSLELESPGDDPSLLEGASEDGAEGGELPPPEESAPQDNFLDLDSQQDRYIPPDTTPPPKPEEPPQEDVWDPSAPDLKEDPDLGEGF